MASTSAMTPATNKTVYRDWEAMYDQHFDLMKEAIDRGDTSILSALEVQSRLSPIDHEATLREEVRSYGPSMLENTEKVVEQLEDTLTAANEATKTDCDTVKNSMESLAKTGDENLEDWSKQLDNNMDALREKTKKELDNVRDVGKEKIKTLPKDTQKSVSQAYLNGARAVSGFITNAVSFLGDCIKAIGRFIQNTWATIKTWAQNTVDWYRGAFNAISDAFSKAIKPHLCTKKAVGGNANGLGSFAAFEDLAKQLQSLGMDNFTLARKGNSWVIEPM